MRNIYITLHEEDKEFLISLLNNSHLSYLIKYIQQSEKSLENKEFILFSLREDDAEEVIGQLAWEAKFSNAMQKALRIDKIATIIGEAICEI